MISAVITDMDGVLIDSEPCWREGMMNVFSSIGVSYKLDDAMAYQGVRAEEIVSKVLAINSPTGFTDEQVNAMIYQKVGNLVLQKAKVFTGVGHLVSVVKDAGLPFGLATSTTGVLASVFIDRIGIAEHLDALCTGDQVSCGKPDPEIYLLCATRLGVDPKNCLVVEDSVNGVLSAKAAGMKCIAIPETHLRDDNRYAVSDLILTSLEEIDRHILNKM